MRRRPCSLAAQMQCALIADDLCDCGSIAGKFKSERDLHVVPDARRGSIRSGVIFNHRHRRRRTRRDDDRCAGASRSAIFLADDGGLLAALVLDDHRPICIGHCYEEPGEILGPNAGGSSEFQFTAASNLGFCGGDVSKYEGHFASGAAHFGFAVHGTAGCFPIGDEIRPLEVGKREITSDCKIAVAGELHLFRSEVDDRGARHIRELGDI
jgi:hypothetical protein